MTTSPGEDITTGPIDDIIYDDYYPGLTRAFSPDPLDEENGEHPYVSAFNQPVLLTTVHVFQEHPLMDYDDGFSPIMFVDYDNPSMMPD